VARALARDDDTSVAAIVLLRLARCRKVAIPSSVLPRHALGVHPQGRGDQLLELLLRGLMERFVGVVAALGWHGTKATGTKPGRGASVSAFVGIQLIVLGSTALFLFVSVMVGDDRTPSIRDRLIKAILSKEFWNFKRPTSPWSLVLAGAALIVVPGAYAMFPELAAKPMGKDRKRRARPVAAGSRSPQRSRSGRYVSLRPGVLSMRAWTRWASVNLLVFQRKANSSA